MTPELFDFLKWCLNGLLVLVAGLSVNAYCERPTRQAQKLTAIGIGVLAGILAAWLNGLEVSQLQQQANSVYVSFGVTGGLSVLALAYLSPIFAQSQPGEAESSLRQGVLERVTKEVEDRRQDSLHQLDHIPLVGVRESASVPGILRPMQVAIQEKTRLLDESISQLFFQDDVAGQLLILGEPGSGKTTELLGLAQTLCQKAQADPQAPIPIIFEWSDWRPSAKSSAKSIEAASLNRWMVDQLQLKYGLDPKISQDWLHRNRLLPLLDGLDELQNFMTEAIVAINAMQEDKKEQHLWLTVCCRLRDYQACEETLNLKTRVTLKPLENKAIRDYLERRNASHLWPLLKDSPQGWLKLAKKPLLLDLMPRAYPAPDCPGQAGEEACRHRLFEDYSHRQLTQEDNWGYSEADSRRYLQRLAQILRRQGQTEFLIEEMQPDWLENPRQKRWFTWGSRLIFGLIFGLIVGLIFGLIVGLIVGLIGGLIFGLIEGLKARLKVKSYPNQGIWESLKKSLIVSLLSSPIWIMGFLLINDLFVRAGQEPRFQAVVPQGLAMGLLMGAIWGGLNSVLQHGLLRWILCRNQVIPWNYARFLTYASQRGLLKQSGGRFRFYHDLLREHFAGDERERPQLTLAPPSRPWLNWTLAVMLLVGWLLFSRNIVTVGPSTAAMMMSPTLEAQDLVLTDDLTYAYRTPQRGDIIIFKGADRLLDGGDGFYIRRILALPQETLEIRQGQAFINHRPLETFSLPPGYERESVTLAADEYFVVGDNEAIEEFEAFGGIIPRDHIHAQVLLRLTPLSRWGRLD